MNTATLPPFLAAPPKVNGTTTGWYAGTGYLGEGDDQDCYLLPTHAAQDVWAGITIVAGESTFTSVSAGTYHLLPGGTWFPDNTTTDAIASSGNTSVTVGGFVDASGREGYCVTRLPGSGSGTYHFGLQLTPDDAMLTTDAANDPTSAETEYYYPYLGTGSIGYLDSATDPQDCFKLKANQGQTINGSFYVIGGEMTFTQLGVGFWWGVNGPGAPETEQKAVDSTPGAMTGAWSALAFTAPYTGDYWACVGVAGGGGSGAYHANFTVQ
jgi:hypothetical protein